MASADAFVNVAGNEEQSHKPSRALSNTLGASRNMILLELVMLWSTSSKKAKLHSA